MYLVKVYIFWKFIRCTIRWDKTYVKKIFLQTKKKLQKMLIAVLIPDSYMSWNTMFVSLKVWGGFSISDFASFLLVKVFSTKNIDSLTSNRHNSFQNSNDRKATQNFALSPPFLSCNNKVWYYICVIFAIISVWVGALQKLTRRQISKYLTALYPLTHLLW